MRQVCFALALIGSISSYGQLDKSNDLSTGGTPFGSHYDYFLVNNDFSSFNSCVRLMSKDVNRYHAWSMYVGKSDRKLSFNFREQAAAFDPYHLGYDAMTIVPISTSYVAAGFYVGIGTTNPDASLHIHNAHPLNDIDNTKPLLKLSNKKGTMYFGIDNNQPWFGTQTDNDLRFETHSETRMVLSNGGNLTLGHAPNFRSSYKLDVNGTVKANNLIIGDVDPAPESKLTVDGNIAVRGIKVYPSGPWADYVFDKDYVLQPLSEVESYITENKKLPAIPSAQEIKEKGMDMPELQRLQMQKIEELTLYTIQQEKEIQELKAMVKKLVKAKN